MKKILFTILTLPILLFAQSFLISDIPVPKTYIQNLDPYPCTENCMQTYIDNDMIFSFLSHATGKLENEKQNEFKAMHISVLNLGSTINNTKLKIAMLLPYKKIGKYTSSTTNATFAYLITKNQSFELKSYKTETENIEDMQDTINEIKNDGFTHVIAPVTLDGANTIVEINPNINIFIPTIHKQDVNSTSSTIYFGAINYEEQSDLLIQEAVSPLVIFYDKSALGKKLAIYEENIFQSKDIEDKKVIKYSIGRKTTNLQKHLKENEEIQLSSFFINTPIVKTSMIMSQLTLYDANATNVLSTQINYNPLILSMTQYSDRKDMIIANSITEHNNVLTQTNAILSNDIEYDWINYATTVGIDYFFHLITNEDREYDIEIIDNQVIHPIELIKPSYSRFIKHISSIEKGID